VKGSGPLRQRFSNRSSAVRKLYFVL